MAGAEHPAGPGRQGAAPASIEIDQRARQHEGRHPELGLPDHVGGGLDVNRMDREQRGSRGGSERWQQPAGQAINQDGGYREQNQIDRVEHDR
jgi:hypothetical protein